MLQGVFPSIRLLSVRSSTRSRVLGLTVLMVAAAALAACGSADPDIVVATGTSTPATETPSPTPTPTPEPWPIPAKAIPHGDVAAPGLVNATSIGLPPPPQVVRNPEPNEGGIVRMFSPALGIDHYIEQVHVVDGTMEDPEDGSYAVGWYPPDDRYDFGVPGVEGNLVFSAHETWGHMQGPFYQVHQAHVGDDIYLEMDNGEIRHYQVARVSRYTLEEMPMSEVLWPSDRPEAEEWMTLYTCGGEIIYGPSGYGDYLARDVLVAKWVGLGGPEETQPAPDATAQQAVEAEVASD